MTTVLRPVGTRGRPISGALLFDALEKYAPFRRLIGRRGFFACLVSLRCLLVAAGVLVGAVLGWGAPRLPGAGSPGLGVAALLIADGYLIVGFWVKHTTGQGLRQVVDPPNIALFRAVDLPPVAVFTAYSAVPVLSFYLAVLAGNAVALGLLGAAGGGLGAAWWVLLVPVVGLLLTLGTTATLAVRPQPARLINARRSVLVLVTVGLAGLGIGRVVGLVSTGGLTAVDLPWLVAPPRWLVAMGLLLVVTLGWLLLWRLRVLSRHSFLVRGRVPARDRSQRPAERRVTTSAYRRTAREFWAHRSSAMLGSAARTVAAAMVFVLGLAAGGVRLEEGVVRQWVLPATTGYLFVTVLIMVGLAFSVVGPAAMMERYRFEWENSGRTAVRVAANALAFHLVLVTPLAVTVALAQTVTSGAVSGRPLAIAWAMVGAATIGETLVPPRIRVDGTSTPGPLAPFVILLLTAPTLGPGIGPWWSLIQCAYGATLLGIGIQCMSRRIQRLPSSSSASPPVTGATAVPSSMA